MKYFTLEELLYSATAISRKIDNTQITDSIRANLIALVENVLDPAREKLGVPVLVSSGYRCPQLNKIVGGVSNSQHMRGEAADLLCSTATEMQRLFEILSKMTVDQLLYERKGKVQWIHVSYKRNGGNRNYVNNNYKA